MGSTLDLEDYHPSVLLHCWLVHLTCKIVSEMTYNVSSGTLNPTIPYQKFGVDSSSCFPFRVQTNKQTDRQTQLNALPTQATIQLAWVTIR